MTSEFGSVASICAFKFCPSSTLAGARTEIMGAIFTACTVLEESPPHANISAVRQ